MKEYIKPLLEEENLEMEDIMTSSSFGGEEPGDVEVDFWND